MLVVICVLSDARDFLLIHECIQTRFWAFVLHVVLGSTSVASLLLVLLHSRKKGCPIRNGGMGAENQCLHCHESQRCILPHREDTHTQPYNYRDYLHSQYSSRHTPSAAALPLITPHKVGEIKIPDLPFSRTSAPLIYVSQQ